MTEQHPITPPPELMEQWRGRWIDDAAEDNTQDLGISPSFMVHIATQAARWGADQELEACCEWASQFNYDDYHYQDELRDVRRPKPPSLAEQATAQLDIAVIRGDCITTSDALPSLRAALERLQELEKGNE